MSTKLSKPKGDLQYLRPDDERWITYISKNSQANIFHHPAWSTVLAEAYSYEPFVLAKLDSKGEIQGGVPLIKIKTPFGKPRLVSLPFTDHCTPLYNDGSTLKSFTDHLISLSRDEQTSRIELRSGYPPHAGINIYSDYVLHNIQLEADQSAVSNRMKRKHFRQVNVAEQRGVRIERGVDTSFIKQFYQLHLQTRRRKGIPVQPWKFFELLSQYITQQGLGFVLLAYKDQECVAGAVFLNWNRTLVYKYSASIEKARQLLAMDLVLWTAIRWGCENGYDWMDMGRTDIEDDGLRYFKQRWGAEEAPLDYSLISQEVYKPSSGSLAKLARPIIQRSPLWVCRAAGELLYKYFG